MRSFVLTLLLCVLQSASIGCSSGGSNGGGCTDAWNKAASACPAAATASQMQQFLDLCNNPQSIMGCGTQGSAFANCVKSASSYTCDSSGQPHAIGCDTQAAAWGTCVLASFDAGFGTD